MSATAHGPNGHAREDAPTQLDNALWALAHGFRVFPCKKAGKKPNEFLVPNGSLDATTDEAQVRKWWSEWRDGNPGINGGVAVDCDKGISSLAEAEAWREKVGLPPTLAVRTGRRSAYGVHYHYTGQTNSCPYIYQGVSGEVRSGNLYVMAPGSVHPDSGQRYEIVIDLPRAAYPPDCEFEKHKKRTAKKLGQDPEPGEKIKTSFRQYWLVSQCGRLRYAGLNGDSLFAALCTLRDQYCEKPEEKTDAMLRQICESGEKNYGVRAPGLDSRPEVAEMLELLNKQFYVIENLGGKCRVCSEEPSVVFSSSFDFTHQSFQDFRNRYCLLGLLSAPYITPGVSQSL